MSEYHKTFEKGSEWLKMDLHLHTKSDKEFKYGGKDEDFAHEFINALENKGIKVVAITNHNKFNYDEFLELHSLARERGIWLLPGVELSINDGKGGVHALIIFDDGELLDKGDFINEFLTIVFGGKSKFNHNNEPLPCKKDIEGTIYELDEFGKNYLFILAHVSHNKGFFKSFDGRRVIELIKQKLFRTKIAAFQDLNYSNHENNVKQWIRQTIEELKNEGKYLAEKDCMPAKVSFSDPKRIEEIGRKYTYIKLGDFDFKSLKFAFLNYDLRIKLEKEECTHPRILSLKIDGGKYIKDVEIKFNESLKSLIGIRGTGKSTIVELIRYCFGKEPIEDKNYKEEIIKNALGNSGRVILEVVGNNGYKYYIKRTIEDEPKVYDEDDRQLNLKPEDVFDFIYYGQKDLSRYAQDSSRLKIIDDFLKEKLESYYKQEKEILKEIENLINELKNIEENIDIDSINNELERLRQKKRIYDDKKVDEKLEKQVHYEKDCEFIKKAFLIIKDIKNEINNLKIRINDKFEDIEYLEFLKFPASAKQEYSNLKNDIIEKFDEIIKLIEGTQKNIKENELQEFNNNFDKVKEELRKIKKELDEENINVEYYFKLEREISRLESEITEAKKKQNRKNEIENKLNMKIDELNNLRKDIWKLRNEFVQKINEKLGDFIRLEVEYRGDKKDFTNFLDDLLEGTGIRNRLEKCEKLAQNFSNGYELLKAVEENNNPKIHDILNKSDIQKIDDKFKEQKYKIISYQPPDKLIVKYKVNDEWKEIEHLSIGQRAAALLSIILLEGNCPIIIDQPEDDIDNHGIYEKIIKPALENKENRQFIFATHNSNIVVLGDSDNVIACNTERDAFSFINGSIDNENIKNKIIEIMEGGDEAFKKRKEIYKIWR